MVSTQEKDVEGLIIELRDQIDKHVEKITELESQMLAEAKLLLQKLETIAKAKINKFDELRTEV